ncbi:LysR substrate-binding domain-containing protein [Roseivivax sediminis]|nr:LysR substrate-binding domain-containing protein [Roseivivax sediminis]
MRHLNRVPLSALRAVEAIGRTGSLSAAADELGVTPGAVSQRLAKAEDRLGATLFTRQAAGLCPTEACARILPRLTLGMEHLAAALGQLAEEDGQSLTISVAPIFASRWLIWRLHRFHARVPSVSVRVEPRTEMTDFRSSEVDIGIRVGASPGRGIAATRLLEQRVFPVCSPALAGRIGRPEDLLSLPVIRETPSLFGWQVWLSAHGMTVPEHLSGPTYADASLCLDAAIAGHGVFMAWETLAADAVEAGQLCAPLPGRHATGQSYWLALSPRSDRKPAARAFRDWITDELDRSVRAWRGPSAP